MSGEAWLYLLSVLINAVNLFLQVFFTIMYSDLEWSVTSALVRWFCLGRVWGMKYGEGVSATNLHGEEGSIMKHMTLD